MLYGSTIWSNWPADNLTRILKLQKRAARVILGANTRSNSVNLFNKSGWLSFYDEAKVNKSPTRKLPQLHTYYHYTDQRGVKGISKSKEIKASTDTTNDAVYGPGVYLTSMDPRNDPKDIIRNNYDDGPRVVNNPKMAAKVENVVAVKLDRNEVEKVYIQRPRRVLVQGRSSTRRQS
ncbi:unnamed protein product [Porites evermanni]|uniref:Tox-ART-HYD1 domain-containing protein n=1 Tax=Porites evermanni TaxID=104178 RepID=A0ABN8QRQ3_9CNID|nr:unnamed protein product [Porites evermanni]